MKDREGPSRRELVAGLAATGALWIGGCSSQGPSGDAPLDPEGGLDPSEGPPVAEPHPDPNGWLRSCESTSSDIEGPYYLEDVPIRTNLDLYGDPGDRIELTGRVLNAQCQPIEGAIIDFWQASPEADYDNSSEEMRYRGQQVAMTGGAFLLRSLMPGWYLNGSQYRPAHIHVKVYVDGEERLTTQLYFAGDPYLDIDPWASTESGQARTLTGTEGADGLLRYEVNLVV